MNTNELSEYLIGRPTCYRCGERLLIQGGHVDLCNKEPKWVVLWYGLNESDKFITFACSFLDILRLINIGDKLHRITPRIKYSLLITFTKFEHGKDNENNRLTQVTNFIKAWHER